MSVTPSSDGQMHFSPPGTTATSTSAVVSTGSPSKCITPGFVLWIDRLLHLKVSMRLLCSIFP